MWRNQLWYDRKLFFCAFSAIPANNSVLFIPGKTVWLEKLLKYQDQLFEPRPKSVIVMYKQYQDTYSKWETEIPNVHCVQGLRKDLLEAGGLDRVLLVLDDWMAETVSDPFFCSLYTAGRHNGLCGIVTIWHQVS